MNGYASIGGDIASVCGGVLGHGRCSVDIKSGTILKRHFGGGCIRRGKYIVNIRDNDQKSALERLSECADAVCGMSGRGIFSVTAAELRSSYDERGTWTCSAEFTVDFYDGGEDIDGQ